MKKQVIIFFLLFAGLPPTLHAYTDQMTVKTDEAWAAALKVLEPYGIRKKNDEKFELETRWMTDTVQRKRGVLRKFASQNYERRVRLKIRLVPQDYDTEVQIQGKFQERPMETNPNLLWRSINPNSDDYEIERQIFMKIMQAIEMERNKSSSPSLS